LLQYDTTNVQDTPNTNTPVPINPLEDSDAKPQNDGLAQALRLGQIRAAAIERLVRQGWTPDRLLPDVLVKRYATAAGARQAVIRVEARNGFDSANARIRLPELAIWLTGEYWSEGRNALDACFSLVGAHASPEVILRKVDDYLGDVERRIAGSYAARLLHPVQPEQVSGLPTL